MRNRSLLKSFLSFSLGPAFSVFIGFLATLITTRLILPQEFGKASLFALVANLLSVICLLGTDQVVVRFFFEYDEEKRKYLFAHGLRVSALLAVLVTALGAIVWPPFSRMLFEEARFSTFVLLMANVLCALAYRFSGLLLRMRQRGLSYSMTTVVYALLDAGFIILFSMTVGRTFFAVALAQTVAVALTFILQVAIEFRFWKTLTFRIPPELRRKLSSTFSYGLPFVGAVLITWLFDGFDKIALKTWGTLAALGLYAAAFRLARGLEILKLSFSLFWAPVAYEKQKEKPNDYGFYEKVFILVSYLMFFGASLLLLAKDVLVLLFGKDYRAVSVIMPFLVLVPALYTISEVSVIGINIAKKTSWHMMITGLCTALCIGLNYGLVPRFGAKGAAAAMGISYIAFFALRTAIARRFFPVPYHGVRTALSIALVTAYALYLTFAESTSLNLVIGLAVIAALNVIYLDLIRHWKGFFRSLKPAGVPR